MCENWVRLGPRATSERSPFIPPTADMRRLHRYVRKCGPGQFFWRPAGNQHEAVAPNGAVPLGFFLKPNRFAYGEKFFSDPGER
jgi:hypothetical protein